VLFYTGYNKQVFSSKPWKKNWRRSVLTFSRKMHILIPKNVITESKVGYSNNQLKSCCQVKGQFQAFGNHGFGSLTLL